jgi:hypothetical protein
MSVNELKFGLRKITTGQFATIDSVEVNEAAINLNYGFGFGVNKEFRIVSCNAKFEFISNRIPFIILNVVCDFEIAPVSWGQMANVESKSITLPVALITHLASLTVGTARGILHCKTENTVFNKYFLPTLNVAESLKNELMIALK